MPRYARINKLRILEGHDDICFEIKTVDDVLADARLDKPEIEQLCKILSEWHGGLSDSLPF